MTDIRRTLTQCTDEGGGLWALRSDPSLECRKPEHTRLKSLGYFLIVAYCIGIPGHAFLILRWAKMNLPEGLHDVRIRTCFSIFYADKTEEAYNYEFLLSMRKLTMVVIVSCFSNAAYYQVRT